MKKLISILGAIGLTATSTRSLISCEKPNNNENGDNKPEPTPEPKKPQQPPKDNNWEEVYAYDKPFNQVDNKYYFIIWRGDKNNDWNINKFYNSSGGSYYAVDEKSQIQLLFKKNEYFFGIKEFYKNKSKNKIIISKNNVLNVIKEFDIYNIDSSYFKAVYRWNSDSQESNLPKIDSDGNVKFEIDIYKEKVKDFLNNYLDVIIQENIRVQQGGNPNYESSIVGTQRIIFDFEIVDESLARNSFKSIYRMILTIDEQKNIIAGSLQLFHNWKYADEPVKNQKDKLGFLFTFMQDKDNIFNFDGNTNSYLENGNIKYYEKMKGQIDINKFLKAFFAYALVPVFQNRSNFIESGYIDNLQYDTVLINFFGLKLVNFRDVLIEENNTNKIQFEKLLNSMFTVSQNFYKDYLRTIFDLENNTYTQGYNKKYGLLANNGFKIYPRYFYFSDKYKSLDFKMYSAYKNRFYNTNYWDVFNYDFSVANNYNINQNEGYVFEGALKDKYGLKYKKMEEQKIGYNVFELQAQKDNDMYRYYDFNFGIYNWQEINNGGLFPDSQWWQAQYESCSWYNLACHIRNAAIWIVNNIPGIKQVNELASGVGKIFQTIYSFFSQTFEVWKFSPALYSTITNLFLLIIFMKFVRLI
ncbi:MAG: hypothetical protein SPLM_10780 [Spiroplasma phoeniceum]|uniref:spiroplasma phage ORF1-like family protein n=1 Tax=Spiroplasma phoeniceum TaxID=47835 RepID=UPI003133F71A